VERVEEDFTVMKTLTRVLLLVVLALGVAACGGPEDEARAKYNAGVEKFRSGNMDGAFADFEEAIRINANMAEAYMNRGSIYAARQEFDKAIEDSTKALDLGMSRAEDQATALTNRAAAYLGQEKYDQAIADATKAIEAKADYAKAYFVRGVANANSQDREKALEDLRRAVEISPNSQEGQGAQQAIDQIEAAP
jgi:tetratricopeptide (TPR) repeat protein